MKERYKQNNVERFLGYQSIYDDARPEPPTEVVQLLTTYLGRKPRLVVDLGCGTGLSTFIWSEQAEKIIGIEPSEDMRNKALEKLNRRDQGKHIQFLEGYADQLDLPSHSVDIITCSQSFHWMEPKSTLKEIGRLLVAGGVFAAYDCDWPPSIHWEIELNYDRLIQKADAIIDRVSDAQDKAKKWNKEEHLQQMKNSGYFSFTKEIVFHKKEVFDAERFIQLALSQGGVQTVLKLGADQLKEEIQSFEQLVKGYFQDRKLEVLLSYRMRLGIRDGCKEH